MPHETDVTENRAKHQNKRGPTRFPGICQDAKSLRVRRTTLFRALTGEWRLPGLMLRYKKLKEEQFAQRKLEGGNAQLVEVLVHFGEPKPARQRRTKSQS